MEIEIKDLTGSGLDDLLDSDAARELIHTVCERLDVRTDGLSVVFIDDTKMTRLKGKYLGMEETTDVLSFPDSEEGPDGLSFLGDILICRDELCRRAEELKKRPEGICQRLILHGLLHLIGFDHEKDEGEMIKKESELARSLGIGEAF